MNGDFLKNVKFSVLDLATVCQNDSLQQTFERSLATARFVEKEGYTRYWFSEHHNMESVASAATSVLIGYVAGGTNTIRVGSGGIMLPNHSPLIIAEQFGTLGSLYPDRIDLGLGRAPGTDGLTAMTIRNSPINAPYDFKANIEQLQKYFSKENAASKVRALPGEGVDVPIWILGSSTDSAYLAAQLGLPYAFAAHFAPAQLTQALSIYKEYFKPSEILSEPYAMACVNVIAADTEEEAVFLSTSMYRMFLGIFTNSRSPLLPPFEPDQLSDLWTPEQEYGVKHMLSYAFIGDKATIAKDIKSFINEMDVQEVMAISQVFDQQKKEHSFRLFKEVMTGL
ncbi:LLM class flavin-dependent oxidoreductase [Niabella ginsengisoli]|uniref:LLM class flavin-dependent oxidoreductase n=1 Tax=Niabella ginsengisoli TaxID=522298 RepID=A0ABS9SLQ8_9BACT|nr:LLM class flavin-dependent oxidoreductase [Niabella ginsengisoli]MCH5599317.1 LLM class flavin-dependent oxidoreductase [Niabella ginsengisoli]